MRWREVQSWEGTTGMAQRVLPPSSSDVHRPRWLVTSGTQTLCIYAWAHTGDDGAERFVISIHEAEVTDISTPQKWRIRFPARGAVELTERDPVFIEGFVALVAAAITQGLIPPDLDLPRENLLITLLKYAVE